MLAIDFFRDPIWQFWGAVLAFAGIVVAVYIYQRQRRRKELSYRVVSSTPLVQVAGAYGGRIQVLWDGKPIPSVSLVVLKLSNTGNQEIVVADYERPVSITFPGAGNVFTAELNRASPASLRPTLKITDRNVGIEPCLLNSGDSVTIAALVESYAEKVEIDGRIAGVKNIGLQNQDSLVRAWVLAGILVLSFIALTLFGSYFFASSQVQAVASTARPDHSALPALFLFTLLMIVVISLGTILGMIVETVNRLKASSDQDR
jgi:hypothetical protein